MGFVPLAQDEIRRQKLKGCIKMAKCKGQMGVCITGIH